MKKLFFVLAAFSLSLALAGELATLHQQLATPATNEPAPKDSILTLPEGVALAPGASLGGLPDRSKHGISEIGLERSQCFAGCPAYTVIIRADGSFRYSGLADVERVGEYTGTVSVGELNQLMTFINESLFMGFEDTYSASFLDAPTTYVMVKKGSETKVIENYANTAPTTVWAIEQLIDNLLETATWDEGGAR
jgi:Domain of unknown function (DUF6438)